MTLSRMNFLRLAMLSAVFARGSCHELSMLFVLVLGAGGWRRNASPQVKNRPGGGPGVATFEWVQLRLSEWPSEG